MALQNYMVVLLLVLIVVSGCSVGKISKVNMKYELEEQMKQHQEEIFTNAIKTNNPLLCEELDNSIEKINCVTKVGYYQNDPTICSQIPDGLYNDFCEIISEQEISNCDSDSLQKLGMGDVLRASCKSIIKKDVTECTVFEVGTISHNMCLRDYNNIFLEYS